MGILSISGVHKHFGGHVVLDSVDMEVDEGSICQLIGPNGCGKTTLINIISGLIKPDKGKITFDGKDITYAGFQDTYNAGMVRTWQIPRPFRHLTALENFLVSTSTNSGESFLYAPVGAKWHADEQRIMDKAYSIMDTVGLGEKKDTLSSSLSGGQQKLLEIGRAMMSDAKMILLDEPIAGVNPTLAKEIFEMITEISRRQNITFLIIEHRLDISLQYVHHVFAMGKGEIITQGAPDDVVRDPKIIDLYLGD